MKRIFAVAFMLSSLAGCATTPVPQSLSSPAPPSRLLAFQDKDETTTGTIIVTRDKGFLGSGCYYSLSINGTLAARLDVAETGVFFIKPGEIILRSGRDPFGKGLCGSIQEEWTQRETLVKSNQTKKFRLLIDANGKTDIQRTDY